MQGRTGGLCLLVALLTSPALGQAQPLSLDEAVGQALARHPSIQAAEEATAAAREGVGVAEADLWPRLWLIGNYRYAQPVSELSIEAGGTTITRELGTEHNASIGFQSSWRLWDWGARSALIDAAEASARAAQATEALRAIDVAYAVRVAYLAAVFYGGVDELTEGSLETARQELADREARLRAGLGADVFVASAAARVAELEARQVDVRSRRGVAVDTLNLLMGRPELTPLELSDDLDAVENGLLIGETEHPMLHQMAAQMESLEWQASSVESTYWPTLDIQSTAAYQFPATSAETDEAGFAYTSGVTLTWQIFDGGSRSHREEQLASQARAAERERAAAEEDLSQDRVQALSRREAADASLAAAARQLEAAETYLRAAQTAFTAGAGTALDVMTAEASVDTANLAALQARFERAAATADLLRAQGIAQ